MAPSKRMNHVYTRREVIEMIQINIWSFKHLKAMQITVAEPDRMTG